MTAIFVGHGSPMNAIANNFFTKSWSEIAKKIPSPAAILVISAHWETIGTRITSSQKQKIIYDFYGFPPELYEVSYEAMGSKDLAAEIVDFLAKNFGEKVELDESWGLDHGAWSVLLHFYPKPKMPILQLSLDRKKSPKEHLEFAKMLKFLRQKNVLILGSGNIVHNLAMLDWRGQKAYDWALDFSAKIVAAIQKNDLQTIIDYQKIPSALASVPTPEHFLPLLYVLAQREDSDRLEFFNQKIDLAAIDMTSLLIL